MSIVMIFLNGLGRLFFRLNPLRAGIVKDLNALDKYKYAGHSVILGKKKRERQNEADVLILTTPI